MSSRVKPVANTTADTSMSAMAKAIVPPTQTVTLQQPVVSNMFIPKPTSRVQSPAAQIQNSPPIQPSSPAAALAATYRNAPTPFSSSVSPHASISPNVQPSSQPQQTQDYPMPMTPDNVGGMMATSNAPLSPDEDHHVITQNTPDGMMQVVTAAGTPHPAERQAVAEVKYNWFERFLHWLGFGKPAAPALPVSSNVHGENHMNLQNEVAAMVRRARAGDQVAIAIIAMTRENAMNGDRTAQCTFDMLVDYCEAHPV